MAQSDTSYNERIAARGVKIQARIMEIASELLVSNLGSEQRDEFLQEILKLGAQLQQLLQLQLQLQHTQQQPVIAHNPVADAVADVVDAVPLAAVEQVCHSAASSVSCMTDPPVMTRATGNNDLTALEQQAEAEDQADASNETD